MQKLLFLCTANYFRSRFAEMLFNHLATERQLNWIAESRGFATNLGGDDLCAISPHAIWGLHSHDVKVQASHRAPIQVEARDFEQADLVIALNEKEHRRYMKQLFPKWEKKIEYWRIADLSTSTPNKALTLTEREVYALVQELARTSAS